MKTDFLKSRDFFSCCAQVLVIFILPLQTACSHFDSYELKHKRLLWGGIGLGSGALVSAGTVPEDQNKSAHVAMGAFGIGALAFSMAEIYNSDNAKKISAQNTQLELQKSLTNPVVKRDFKELFQYPASVRLGKSPSLELPAKTKVLVFSTDRWHWIDEKWQHQNLQFEFYPPAQ